MTGRRYATICKVGNPWTTPKRGVLRISDREIYFYLRFGSYNVVSGCLSVVGHSCVVGYTVKRWYDAEGFAFETMRVQRALLVYMHDVFWQIPVRIGLNPGTLGLRDPIPFLHIFLCPTTLHRSHILIGAKIKNSVKKGLTLGPDRVN